MTMSNETEDDKFICTKIISASSQNNAHFFGGSIHLAGH